MVHVENSSSMSMVHNWVQLLPPQRPVFTTTLLPSVWHNCKVAVTSLATMGKLMSLAYGTECLLKTTLRVYTTVEVVRPTLTSQPRVHRHFSAAIQSKTSPTPTTVWGISL